MLLILLKKKEKDYGEKSYNTKILIQFLFLLLFLISALLITTQYMKDDYLLLKRVMSLFFACTLLLCLVAIFKAFIYHRETFISFSKSRLQYIKQEIMEYMNDRNNWIGNNCKTLITSFFCEDLSPLDEKEQYEFFKWLKDEWPAYAIPK